MSVKYFGQSSTAQVADTLSVIYVSSQTLLSPNQQIVSKSPGTRCTFLETYATRLPDPKPTPELNPSATPQVPATTTYTNSEGTPFDS